MTSDRHSALPALCLLVAMLLWGSSFIALKLAFAHYHPMVVIFGRMLIAGLCFLLALKWLWKFDYQPGDLKYLLLMAASEPCLYFLFEAEALVNTSAAQAGMITSMLPLMVALGAFIWLGEQVRRQTLAGFALAIAGAVWLSLAAEADPSAPNPLWGNFLEFMAMVCATVYTLSLKYLTRRYSPWLLTAIQAWVGSLFFLPFLFLPDTELPQTWDPQSGWAIIYLGTLINIGAYGLYNFGVSRVPANLASGYVNLIPVFTVILAFLILGEVLSLEQLLACTLVFGGVYLSQRRSKSVIENDSPAAVQ